MSLKHLTLSAIMLSSNLSLAANDVPDSLFLHCKAKKNVLTQPCGGTNTKELKFFVSVDGSFQETGYTLNHTYNGCYPTSSNQFGKITQVQVDGHKIRLTLNSLGIISSSKIPYMKSHLEEAEGIQAVYDTATKKLELKYVNQRHPSHEPNQFTCSHLSL